MQCLGLPTQFCMIWLFNLSTMSLCGEDYSRNQIDYPNMRHFKIVEIKYIVVLSYYLKDFFFHTIYITMALLNTCTYKDTQQTKQQNKHCIYNCLE